MLAWLLFFAQMQEPPADNAEPADREWVLERLARSRDPIISLYAEIDRRLAPQ